MNQGITIDISVTPQIKAWLTAKNNNFPVIKLKAGDPIIKLIQEWLTKPNKKSRKKPNPENSIKLYIPLCSHKNIYNSHFLSENRQKFITDFFAASFKAEFIKHVIDKIEEGYSQKKAIYDFLFFYNLRESDFNYETLKKSWDRSQDKANYYNIATKHNTALSLIIPITLDFNVINDYFSLINCPLFINT